MVPWAALLTAFAAGGAWAKQSGDVAELKRTKVDRTELAFRDSALTAELRALTVLTQDTHDRVQQMYCVGKPVGCR